MSEKPRLRRAGTRSVLKSPWFWITIGSIALIVGLLFLIPFLRAGEDDVEDIVGEEAIGAVGEVTWSEFAADPASYYGQTIQLEANVGETVSPMALTLDAGDVELLVVGNEETLAGITADEAVVVEGEVVEFSTPDVESRLGVDLSDEQLSEFEGQPALVADAIQPVP